MFFLDEDYECGGSFKYIRCDCCEMKPESYITQVTFDISRYGAYQSSIKFIEPVTEEEAIEAVEKYLSTSVSKEYFDEIKDDIFNTDLIWDSPDFKQYYKCKGDFLGDCKFLERIYSLSKNTPNSVAFLCGS